MDTADDYPLVSVGIPTHGRPDLVRRAVAAVVGQIYPGPIECIVVHDGEPPDYGLDREGNGRRVRAIANERTRGLTGARNSALEVASGAIIAWCDDDDLWHDDKLRLQIDALLEHPQAPAVGSGIRWIARDGRVTIQAAPGGPVTRADLMRRAANAPLGLHSSNIAVRREVYDKVGWYDESLPSSRCEDFDLFLRLSSIGPVLTVPDALVDVAWDPEGAFSPQRWRTIGDALQLIVDRNPDFATVPEGMARICRQIANNYSLAALHGPALRWAVKAIRSNWRDLRAWLVGGCALLHVRVIWPFRLMRLWRRARGRGPVRTAPSPASSV